MHEKRAANSHGEKDNDLGAPGHDTPQNCAEI
jgi:hypothetical protein